jgi:hypothetical protein
MSWLGRLLGRSPAVPAVPPADTVVVPPDIAARLTAEGQPLASAVEQALREHLAHLDQSAQQQANGDKPFWLAREDEGGDLEERLRDRIAQRRAGEGEAER